MANSIRAIFIFFTMVFVPSAAHAQLLLSEVMFDLEVGSDTGREWVELFNSGSHAIDVTTWRLFEAETNHKFTEFQGGVSLGSGVYAVIADNPAKFLTDNPSYSGMLLDSAFSLSNSGEQLVLRDADLVDRDAVTYTAESGAAGDGRTLSRVASNSSSFVAQVSTPGSGTLVVLGGGVTGEEVDDEVPPTGEANSATTGTAVVGGSSFPVEPQIYAHAGKDRFVLVGADSIFEGKALSKDGELLEGNGVRYVWNFGDGAVGEGVVVSHHFAHPGVYVVVLDVSSGKYVGTHRITVTAEQPHLTVKRLDDGAVQILNASTRDIDLSFWHVRVGDIFFTIPKNTILLRRGTSTLRQDATKLPPGLPALVYPNGREALLAEESAPPVTVTPVASSLGSPMTSKAMPVSASSRKNGNAAEIVQQDSVDAQEGAHDMATTTESSVAQSSGQVASAGHIFGSLPHWGWIVALVGMLSVVGAGLLYALPVEVRSDEATVAESGKHDDPAYIDASKWTIIDADEEAR